MENRYNFLTPPINVNETEDVYSVSIDLPGVEKKDLEINLNDGQVTVIAERRSNDESKNNDYTLQESMVGKYQRSFELPSAINEDKIKAKFKSGVLNLIIPKVEKSELEVKKIAIS